MAGSNVPMELVWVSWGLNLNPVPLAYFCLHSAKLSLWKVMSEWTICSSCFYCEHGCTDAHWNHWITMTLKKTQNLRKTFSFLLQSTFMNIYLWSETSEILIPLKSLSQPQSNKMCIMYVCSDLTELRLWEEGAGSLTQIASIGCKGIRERVWNRHTKMETLLLSHTRTPALIDCSFTYQELICSLQFLSLHQNPSIVDISYHPHCLQRKVANMIFLFFNGDLGL